MSFDDLGLTENTLKSIKECGYTEPTPIQAQAIPVILMMRDLIGIAQTGTGKTASFTLPMIEVLANGSAKARMPRSLVLCPTRELAAQVAENFDTYAKYQKLNYVLLVGGESVAEQRKALEGEIDVLIATPGRFMDMQERGLMLLTDIQIVVIDEADRMLDMGFIPDIEKIFSSLPSMRQTLLFSATMPDEIRKLTEKFLQNPKQIAIAPDQSTAKTVEQFIAHCSPKTKKKTLVDLIEKEDVKNAFIFCNRKRDADSLSKWMGDKGYSVSALHGDMHQTRRYEVLEDFKKGKIKFLICSDIVARGIDIADVSHVFNFDVPFNAEDYVHRIGRTGRAGMTGRAFTLAMKDDEKNIAAIEKLIGKKLEENINKSSSKAGSKSSEATKPKSKQAKKNHQSKQNDKAIRSSNTSQKHVSSNKPHHQSKSSNKRAHATSGDMFDEDTLPAFLK